MHFTRVTDGLFDHLQRRGEPLRVHRRVLHVLSHHGAATRRAVFPGLAASQQQQRRAAELRRLPYSNEQLVVSADNQDRALAFRHMFEPYKTRGIDRVI